MTHQQQDPSCDGKAVVVRDYTFTYPNKYGEDVVALQNVSVELEHGACCLVSGANGAGKSTFLRALAGKMLTEKEKVIVLGRPAFYQTLGLSGVNFLGGGWTKTIAFAGSNVPVQADILVTEMCESLQASFPDRRERLYDILEIEPHWRMHQVSDGQRRRVQIMLGLLRPFKLLLLDEMTVDLDICARADFLAFLKSECEERGATVMYCTHIFDGLDNWPTHLMQLEEGRLVRCARLAELQAEPGFGSLYAFIMAFLRKAQERRKANKGTIDKKGGDEDKRYTAWAGFGNDGYTSGRLGGFDISALSSKPASSSSSK